jgi:hypothetical protein
MSRNPRENLGLTHESTSRLERLMNDYIEYALVEADPGDLAAVEAVEMDAKDRRVPAAALSADADILLTNNTKDFPAPWMAERGIELLTAGELLVRLAGDFPDKIRAAHAKTVHYSPSPKSTSSPPLSGPLARTPQTRPARPSQTTRPQEPGRPDPVTPAGAETLINTGAHERGRVFTAALVVPG